MGISYIYPAKYNVMKKIMSLFAASLLFVACGGPSQETYDAAAQEMCDCVEQKRAEADPENFLDTDDVFFAFCALDIAINHSVDCSSDEFGAALSSKCADLTDLQKEYGK
jgi:hypothetical protein